MDEILDQAVRATIDVVNARAEAINNDGYMRVLEMIEEARFGPVSEAYWMSKDGLEDDHDYYEASLDVAECLDRILVHQQTCVNNSINGGNYPYQAEQDSLLTEEFSVAWGVWKTRLSENIKRLQNIIVLDQTPDDE
jgi:hypothetical protein